MPLYEPTPAADQPVVQARRTTTLALSTSFADVSLDTTDVESNSDIIDHDAGTPDNIIVKVAGNYKIEYDVQGAPGAGVITSLQVRKNDTSVVAGSERVGESTGTDTPPISGSCVVALAENDFLTLQAKASAGTPNLAAGATVNVVHLAGEKGDKGDASATDVDAIHVNVGSEISGITEKTTPASADLLVIEDSAAAGVKKRLQIGNLPGGVSLASTAPVDVTKAAAAVGDGATAARNNHKHDISTAAPVAAAVGDTQSEGDATSLARSNHRHAVARGTPVSVGTANAAGAGTDFAAGNHVHAGLTRGAADFNAFTAKTTPATADLLLIEDSADSNNKKKITVGSINGGFGGSFQSGASEGESTYTGGTAYQQKLRLAASIPADGNYLIQWYAEMKMDNVSDDFKFRVQVDDTTTLAELNIEPKDVTNYYPISGFIVQALTAGTRNIDMDYGLEVAGNNVYIRRSRLALWRVS